MASNVPKVRGKKSKLAKNKKKSWKNIDITDIEDVLEDERLQERTGGLVAEKTDEQLFLVDKVKPADKPEKTELHQRKRRAREPKPLKCYSNLEPNPNIKPARIPCNIRKKKEDTKRLADNLKTKRTATDKKIQKQATKRRQETFNEERGSSYDLWQDDSQDTEDPHYMMVTKKRRAKVPKHYHDKTSAIPSVQVPHPGASYNPTYEDHQNLLAAAYLVEEKKVQKEKRLYNSLEAKFKTVTKESLQETLMSEMTAGLRDDEHNTDETFTEEELEKISVNPPVRREDKKTKTQRNKEKKAKLMEKLKKEEKFSKTKDSEIYRLKSIKAEIKQQEEEATRMRLRREQNRKEQVLKTRKLGKLKFEEPEMELKLSDELEGSLRLLKPEGHLLSDRFKSLQKRNIIEPRQRAKKKKTFRSKLVERRGHKELGKR